MLKDLKQQYNSPFVNLWLYPRDFIKLLENFDYYLKQDVTFIKNHNYDFPVGMLDDIKIFFTHFETEKKQKKNGINILQKTVIKDIKMLLIMKIGLIIIIKNLNSVPVGKG